VTQGRGQRAGGRRSFHKSFRIAIGRVKEIKRTFARHSNFYLGLYGYNWLNFYPFLSKLIHQLMNLSPNKRPFYQRGQKAMNLIMSAF
jgi:hypothetical protein